MFPLHAEKTVIVVGKGVAGIYSWSHLLYKRRDTKTNEAVFYRPDGQEFRLQCGALWTHWKPVEDAEAEELRGRIWNK